MSQKNALAGLWWGGGKGVISCPPDFDRSDRALRQAVFQEYGDFISSIGGAYVTAEDVGTNTEDMGWIFSKTRFITCIPGVFGGSGNPSRATARGVVVAMEAALEARGEGTLHGKRVVVQGVGHVGEVIIELLLEGGAEVLASLMPRSVEARLAIEAGIGLPWRPWVGDHGQIIAIEQFGLSGPAHQVYQAVGLTAQHVIDAAKAQVVQRSVRME